MYNSPKFQKAILDTLQQRSHLSRNKSVLEIDGMMGIYTRHLLNNLVAQFCGPETSYLEVGCYRGASTIAALHGNVLGSARSIDNFTQFDKRHTNKSIFLDVLGTAKASGSIIQDAELVCADSSDPKSYESIVHPPAVFFYDGNHDYEHQSKALPILIDALIVRPARMIYVVDDWDFPAVSSGCLDSLKALTELRRIKVQESVTIPNNAKFHDPANWWNGIGIFDIQVL